VDLAHVTAPSMSRAPVSTPRARLARTALAGAVLFWVGGATAQVPLRDIAGFFRPGRGEHGRGLLVRGGSFDSRLARLPGAVWLGVGERHAVIRVPDSDLAGIGFDEFPELLWSPPRHLLMDRARATLRLEAARARGAGSGQGVVIGIVDSGVDSRHADLRHADGTTRLAWWLDFASNPAGTHPELESALGCQAEAGLRCQVLDAVDLDRRLGNDVAGDEPHDTIGHGTMVASIAAGNGSWGGGSAFAGLAPEATLIAARVTGSVGTIADSDVLLATRFVFERAAELGMPAVVNLSLGSDFGAHDGSSELSEALAELAGPAWPGRAIVVAGGNSGQVRTGLAEGAPDPFGIHTEIVAGSEAPGRAALLTPYPANGRDTTDASLFIWIDLYPADALSVGVVLPDGTRVEPVAVDQTRVLESGELTVAVVHGVGGDRDAVARGLADLPLDDVLPTRGAAVVLIDGRWRAGGGFAIDISGEGRADLWVQSEGDLAPEAGTVGALFAAASARATVTIPAVHPGLIAVGASIDRVDWSDYGGALRSVAELPVSPAPVLGAAAFFSSAGPSSRGDFKPDLLAPGAFVIAAMAAAADPRSGGAGIFSGGLCPGLGCQVISDGYALSAGTSMAAPMVSGAAALLLERRPELTQPELRGLLIAGSSALPAPADVASREGAGLLDVAGSIAAEAPPPLVERPSSEQSRLRAAAASIVADAQRSLSALLWLKDASGAPYDADTQRLSVSVSGGELRSSALRIAPGLYEFALAAPPPAPLSMSVDVAVDDEPLLSLTLPIEGGRGPASGGGDGGCQFAHSLPGRSASSTALGPLGALLLGIGYVGRRRALKARPRRA
jgi:subtilisin family serine protease